MIQTIRDAWALIRLVRRLKIENTKMHCSTITLVVEPERLWQERCRVAIANGEKPPGRETAWEVAYYPDMANPAMARKDETLAGAIGRALDRPTRND